MSKALITFGTGKAEELADIAEPSRRAFAERHGYELQRYWPETGDNFWPAPWLKVACLEHALKSFGAALWVDADIVIVDPSEDIPVRGEAWQAMTVHHTQDGEVPNTGVWLCRRPMLRVLSRLWGMEEYRRHPWWEQGAIMELLGYDSWARPTQHHGPTELYHRTQFLSTEWNSHPWDEAEEPRFMHATMRSNPARVMKEWADAAAV